LCAACLALRLGGDTIAGGLIYERRAILSGQVWRFVTGHFVHTNWFHVGLNLTVAAAILLALGQYLKRPGLPFLICLLGVSTGLLAFEPEIHWYAGLSGALHGLLACGALRAARRTRQWFWWIVLVVLVAKVAWEQLRGTHGSLEEWIGAKVIVQSHLWGAVSGVLAWAALYRRSN
jgi:rhomboid family GlyGly-CTERM serine protease